MIDLPGPWALVLALAILFGIPVGALVLSSVAEYRNRPRERSLWR